MFTQRKFLSLTLTQQHKHCAHLLKSLYLFPHCEQSDYQEEIQTYHRWMDLPLLENWDLKNISNAFHDHIQKAGVSVREPHLLPSIRKGDRKSAQEPSLNIAIVLDHLRSAHNVGSIIRTIDCFSLGTLYFQGQTPQADHPQVQDTAMGAAQWVRSQPFSSWNELPKPIIALETSKDAISLFDFQFPDSFTIVVGNEEYGCSDNTLQSADMILEIPMYGHKNSLNVANAFAIVAYAICNQMRRKNEKEISKTT
jgi:tRNA G18 (ribose-2'-O)-methylase SpoU